MIRIDKKYVLFVVLLLLGMVMAMQGRTILEISRQQTSVVSRIEDYKKQLVEEQKKSEELKNMIIENQNIKDKSLKDLSDTKSNEYLKYLGEELKKAQFISGLTDVSGKGIKVVLNDAPAREIDNPNLLIIHDSDVYGVINELKKAGAQAISINGERIISDSEQVCAGPTIRINKNRYPVPYEILAIGDPDIMAKSLDESKPVMEMRDFKIGVDIKKSDNIVISKYHNKLDNLVTGLEAIK